MKDKDIKVSVCCAVYNHEKYLRKCLDGFVMQKTNFAFEVLINDDKSTDASADIIREYCEKYPDLFVPVFQTENQYSKGVLICDDILYPLAKGKYIAICEGDDYWCDEKKLQLQYDFMEKNNKCVICFHNTIDHYLDGSHSDKPINDWETIHFLTAYEAFFTNYVHTSSYFVRKEYAQTPYFGRKCISADYVLRDWLYTIGKMAVLPQVMSVYNNGVPGGASQIQRSDSQKRIENLKNYISFLKDLDSFTKYKYSDTIKKRISEQDLFLLIQKNSDKVVKSANMAGISKAMKEIISHEYYPEFIKSKHGINRLLTRFKYEGYIIYPIWRFAYRLYYGKRKDN